MAGNLECIECNKTFLNLYCDPRSPLLDEDKCLCWGCCDGAHDEVVEEAEETLEAAKVERTEHQENPNR